MAAYLSLVAVPCPCQKSALAHAAELPLVALRSSRRRSNFCIRAGDSSTQPKCMLRCCAPSIAQSTQLEPTLLRRYKNHKDIRVAIQRSGVPREQIWLTSKVMTIKGGLTRAATARQVGSILSDLGVAYVDLLLLHHAKNNAASERTEQWQALIAAKANGQVRHIGVSNFDRAQLEALREATGVLPEVNQIEYHPFVPPETHGLVRWCKHQGVAVTAYGSLGSSSTGGKAGGGVSTVAARHGVSSAAVLLRWALSKGCAVIPGATSSIHIYENLHPKQFELSKEDGIL